MKSKVFNQLATHTVKSCLALMTEKSKEYASSDDKFHNFKTAARHDDTTPEKALHGMELKHRISVEDMIKDTERLTPEQFKEKYNPNIVDEKIADSINYLLLLKGLLYERLAKAGYPCLL